MSDGKGGHDQINYILVIKERFDTVLKFIHEEYPIGSKDLRKCSGPPRAEIIDTNPLDVQGGSGKDDVLIVIENL